MRIFIAPIQGHTDAAWRHFHHKIYGGNHKYFTPFMRCERGEIRPKDLREFTLDINDGVNVEPQVIFRDVEELDILLAALTKAGATNVNLNMGCPFPLQTGKGRGAAFIKNLEEASKVMNLLRHYDGLKFSVKMRLGMEDPDEWRPMMEILNSIRLDNLYVHPRVARQQYKGELFLDRFAEILKESENPVVFNGEIKTNDDIKRVEKKFPETNGVMIARGILARPSLAAEFEEGEWSGEKRLQKLMDFHNQLFSYYERTLCGDSQILSKIKPFWEYTEEEIGRKAWKAIKKASSMSKYRSAIAMI